MTYFIHAEYFFSLKCPKHPLLHVFLSRLLFSFSRNQIIFYFQIKSNWFSVNLQHKVKNKEKIQTQLLL